MTMNNMIRMAQDIYRNHMSLFDLRDPMRVEEYESIAFELAILAVITSEREECAKTCEEIYTGYEASGDWPTPEMCAAAIRARGQ